MLLTGLEVTHLSILLHVSLIYLLFIPGPEFQFLDLGSWILALVSWFLVNEFAMLTIVKDFTKNLSYDNLHNLK